MSDHEAVAAAGEAPVGDQCDLIREAAADDGTCGTQHLAHARTADRALVADHDHFARPHAPGKYGRGRLLLTVEYPGDAAEGLALLAGNLGDRPFGSHVPVQHDEVTLLPERLRQRPHNVLPSNIRA